jgi:hypothetical protein
VVKRAPSCSCRWCACIDECPARPDWASRSHFPFPDDPTVRCNGSNMLVALGVACLWIDCCFAGRHHYLCLKSQKPQKILSYKTIFSPLFPHQNKKPPKGRKTINLDVFKPTKWVVDDSWIEYVTPAVWRLQIPLFLYKNQ